MAVTQFVRPAAWATEPVAVIVVDVARAIPTAAAMRRIERGTSILPFVRFGLDNVRWVPRR
jgi:hypothetical protein